MRRCVAVLLVSLACDAQADADGAIEAFFSTSKTDTAAIEDVDGDGFGLRGRFDFGGPLVSALYASESLDSNADLSEFRIGGGFAARVGPGARVSGQIDYASFELDPDAGPSDEQDGIGVYLGVSGDVQKTIAVYGRAGYLKLDDINGFDGGLGVRANLGGPLGLFLEYRAAHLKGDSSELNLSSIRGGFGLHF